MCQDDAGIGRIHTAQALMLVTVWWDVCHLACYRASLYPNLIAV